MSAEAVEKLHIVCPSCSATNRVPRPRLGERPKCGKCGQLLFQGRPVEVDAAAFEKHLTHNDIPLVVDFWAPWCGPCHAMAPAYAQAAGQLEPEFRLAKLDTESAPTIAARYAIRSIPTLVLFRSGRERARQAGAIGTRDIVRWVRAHAATTGA